MLSSACRSSERPVLFEPRLGNSNVVSMIALQVIREVINVHSEELARQWKEEEDEEESMRVEQSSHGYTKHSS